MKTFISAMLIVVTGASLRAQTTDADQDGFLLPGRLPVPVIQSDAAARFDARSAMPVPRTLALTYRDSSTSRLLWRIPSSYGTFLTLSIGERFDLPVEKGRLDSIHIAIRELPLGTMRFDVWKDTLRKRVTKDTFLLHYPNYTAGAIDTAAVKAGQQDTARMISVLFRSREVGKYFHIAGAPNKDSGITSLFSTYTDAVEGTVETITLENARAHMLWSIQNNPPIPVHMRGRFQDNQGRFLSPGLYMVAYVTIDGASGSETIALPSSAVLSSAFPHPASGDITVPFSMAAPGRVRLDLYTARGHHVTTVAEGAYAQGAHQLSFSTADLPAGTYFLHLISGTGSSARAFTVVR